MSIASYPNQTTYEAICDRCGVAAGHRFWSAMQAIAVAKQDGWILTGDSIVLCPECAEARWNQAGPMPADAKEGE